jgi:hypothetical protein
MAGHCQERPIYCSVVGNGRSVPHIIYYNTLTHQPIARQRLGKHFFRGDRFFERTHRWMINGSVGTRLKAVFCAVVRSEAI